MREYRRNASKALPRGESDSCSRSKARGARGGVGDYHYTVFFPCGEPEGLDGRPYFERVQYDWIRLGCVRYASDERKRQACIIKEAL